MEYIVKDTQNMQNFLGKEIEPGTLQYERAQFALY
jgi:hypothetical protein